STPWRSASEWARSVALVQGSPEAIGPMGRTQALADTRNGRDLSTFRPSGPFGFAQRKWTLHALRRANRRCAQGASGGSRSSLLVLSVTLLVLIGSSSCGRGLGAAGEYEAPARIGQVRYEALREISGIAASGQSDDLLWVHNDSGDEALIYGIRRDGSA